MLDTFDAATPFTASAQARRARVAWVLWFLALLGLSGGIGLLMLRGGLPASPSPIGWLIYILGAALIFKEPRYGVYLIVLFGLMGDGKLVYWFPFVKNLSSDESLLHLHDDLIISPMEIYLTLTYVAWLGRMALRRKWAFYTGELFWPAAILTAFVLFGLVHGLGKGGNLNVALWEARAIFYLPAMLILVSNLFQQREHFTHLFWFAAVALFVEGWFGVRYYLVEIEMDLSRVESITEHSAAIHINTMFVMAAAVWLYRGCSARWRLVLPLLLLPMVITYVATQRRAAFLTLGVALALMGIILLKENRRLFALILPPILLFVALYFAAFWNGSGALAKPVQSVKSVIAEDEANADDQASNAYRKIENLNLEFTIRQEPLLGLGFGQKFYMLYPLPDISFFEWWEYIPHNSIIWFWVKTGVGGFFTLVFLVALTIANGVRALWRLPGGNLSAVTLTAVLYIIMHYIYAYVDMSWDPQSMIYVGTMMGVINRVEYVAAQPVSLPRKRWPWQPDPQPPPGLKPLPQKWAFWTERD